MVSFCIKFLTIIFEIMFGSVVAMIDLGHDMEAVFYIP